MSDLLLPPRQIRAARALAEWRQEDLAEASGMSTVAIRKIEQGTVQPRPKTIDAIRAAFESKGIVMTKDGGARMRKAAPT